MYKWMQRLAPFFLGILLPWVLVSYWPRQFDTSETLPAETTEELSTEVFGHTTSPVIRVLMDDHVVDMELEEYVFGVVLGEMPASFEVEALKAQAIVARTFTMRSEQTGGKHEQAQICTDSDCCQAYCSESTYLENGGSGQSVEKVRSAVEETEGQVLTYDGELIEATYFSCSGGRTEDAAAVWGAEIPYLQATDSPGEEGAAHYIDTVTFSAEQFRDALSLTLSGMPGSWIGSIRYTDGGGVASIMIGEKEFSGTEMRRLLGLRSTAFVITAVGDTVTITTRGFGHRVGMSQYGADAMAVSGASCEEILAHYYSGTKLAQVFDKTS